jgi:tetratricopeptide (TPR) repeat protein
MSKKRPAGTTPNGQGSVAAQTAQQIIDVAQTQLEEINRDPSSAAALLAAGKIHEIEDQLTLAIDCYMKAAGKEYGLNEATARLALAQLKVGQFARSLETALTLVERAPDFTFSSLIKNKPLSALTVLGEALLANGSPEDAALTFRRALTLQAADSQAAARLSLLLLDQGNPAEAKKLVQQVEPTSGLFSVINSMLSLADNDPELLPVVRRAKVADIPGSWA